MPDAKRRPAAANMGCRTLLITMDMGKFAQMSCNPAVGGVAKGQIVRGDRCDGRLYGHRHRPYDAAIPVC